MAQFECGRLEKCQPCTQLSDEQAKKLCVAVGFVADMPALEAMSGQGLDEMTDAYLGSSATPETIGAARESVQEIIETMRRY